MRQSERDRLISELRNAFDEALAAYGHTRVEEVLGACGKARWLAMFLDGSQAKLKPLPANPQKLRTALERLPEEQAVLTLAVQSARLRAAYWLRRRTARLQTPLFAGSETREALQRGLESAQMLLSDELPYWLCPFDEAGQFSMDDWLDSIPEHDDSISCSVSPFDRLSVW